VLPLRIRCPRETWRHRQKQLLSHGFTLMNTDLNRISDPCSSAFRGKEFAFRCFSHFSVCLCGEKVYRVSVNITVISVSTSTGLSFR